MSQQDEFQERLGRIVAQGQRTGAPMSDYGRTTPRKPVSTRNDLAVNLLYPLSLAGAFLLGILAVGLGHYARFQIADGAAGGQTTDVDLMITLGLGFAISLVLGQAFRLSSKEHIGLQGIGVFVAVCTFHNLFHWAPGPMAAVFSPAHVAAMQEIAPANTAAFRGMVFNLAEPEPVAEPPLADPEAVEEPPAPRLIELDSKKK